MSAIPQAWAHPPWVHSLKVVKNQGLALPRGISYNKRSVALNQIPLLYFSRRGEEFGASFAIAPVVPTKLDVRRICEIIRVRFGTQGETKILEVGSHQNLWSVLILEELSKLGVRAKAFSAEIRKEIVESGCYFGHENLSMVHAVWGDVTDIEQAIQQVKTYASEGIEIDEEARGSLIDRLEEYKAFARKSLREGAQNLLDYRDKVDVVLNVWRLPWYLPDPLSKLGSGMLIQGIDRRGRAGFYGDQFLFHKALDVFAAGEGYQALCAWEGFSFDDPFDIDNRIKELPHTWYGNQFEIQVKQPVSSDRFRYVAGLPELDAYPWEKEFIKVDLLTHGRIGKMKFGEDIKDGD